MGILHFFFNLSIHFFFGKTDQYVLRWPHLIKSWLIFIKKLKEKGHPSGQVGMFLFGTWKLEPKDDEHLLSSTILVKLSPYQANSKGNKGTQAKAGQINWIQTDTLADQDEAAWSTHWGLHPLHGLYIFWTLTFFTALLSLYIYIIHFITVKARLAHTIKVMCYTSTDFLTLRFEEYPLMEN